MHDSHGCVEVQLRSPKLKMFSGEGAGTQNYMALCVTVHAWNDVCFNNIICVIKVMVAL